MNEVTLNYPHSLYILTNEIANPIIRIHHCRERLARN
jgi:hypothetical protein